MFSADDFSPFIKDIISKLSKQSTSGNSNGSHNNDSGISITPSQALVIAGLIGGVLEVTSILVDRSQLVQIVLSGSLKKKTELEKLMDHVGNQPFEEVMKAVLEKLK